MQKNHCHKDASPEETVERIKMILEEFGLYLNEVNRINVADKFYSIRVYDSLNCGANGKGASMELALASAYAEYMERLQNDMAFVAKFGLKEDFKIAQKDCVVLTIKEILEDCSAIFKTLFPNMLSKIDVDKKIEALPYYSVFDDNISYLPSSIIKTFCGSNGMAAGNTAHEAIVQGISEIFERHVLNYVYLYENISPIIPIALLKGHPIYDSIDKLVNRGFKLIIKDFSLGNKYPVVAVIILNKDSTKAWMNFGSDLVFDIAVERCISEFYQGIDDVQFEMMKMVKIDYSKVGRKISYSKCDIRNSAAFRDYNHYLIYQILHMSLFSPLIAKEIPMVFKDSITNRDGLMEILDILKNNNLNLYIRDVSFLDFPTYHIYIPTLSELHDEEVFFKKEILVNNVTGVLLNLNNIELKCVVNFINTIEEIIYNDPYFTFLYVGKPDRNFVTDFSRIIVSPDSDILTLDLDFLLACLSIKINDYEKAYKYLNSYVDTVEYYHLEPGNIDYYKGVVLYLQLVSNNVDPTSIYNTISLLFDSNICNEIFNDLENPERVFQYFELPSCGNNCGECQINSVSCKYSEWLDIAAKINNAKEKKIINQISLRDIFKL